MPRVRGRFAMRLTPSHGLVGINSRRARREALVLQLEKVVVNLPRLDLTDNGVPEIRDYVVVQQLATLK